MQLITLHLIHSPPLSQIYANNVLISKYYLKLVYGMISE